MYNIIFKIFLINRPCTCQMIDAWDKKNNSEGETVKWLKVNTKSCPNCNKPIEKNQGCNHMTCHKTVGGCGYEFCWICSGEWKKHGSSYYQCNFFNQSKEEDKNYKQIKTELQKYTFYYERYHTHFKSRDHITKIFSDIKKNQERLINEKNINYIDSLFLMDGYYTILSGLRVLMNTYIFGFYMKEDCNSKQLYEYNQYLLERNVDFLVEKLEDKKYFNSIIDNENFDIFISELSKYRDTIKNYSSATNLYIQNVLREIEEKMMDDLIKI